MAERGATAERHGGMAIQAHFLRSMCEICACMGVGKETVQEWISQGAPIAVERQGRSVRYSAEAVSLQRWRVERHAADR